MKRGIINFLRSDLITAQGFISDEFAEFKTKVESALKETGDTIKVEVNREEVETLLDLLPPPPADSTHQVASLRRSLQEFLYLP